MSQASATLQCPLCSRVLTFSHEAATVLCCTCGAVLRRNEAGMLLNKPYYRVHNPTDPIQPGTEGKFREKSFRVLGRFRAWMDEFVFSYWTILYEDGNLGYLGEGYGQYALYGKTTLERYVAPSDLQTMKVGNSRELFANTLFVLERRYGCYKWEVEGELWLPECNDSFNMYEFASANGRHVELLQFLNSPTAFEVYYLSFEELNLTHLRSAAPENKTVACPNCHKPNELKAFPLTQSFGCLHCGNWFALQNGVDIKRAAGGNQTDTGPDLQLGARGMLHGVEYEVIGYMQKEENNRYRSQWKEYTLYNRLHGFAFLSEFNGHWIFVQERGDAPVLPTRSQPKEFTYAGEPFQLYNEYSFAVVNAKGSFPYNLFNDEHKEVQEFISPPEVWIMEKSQREGIVWFRGTHINGRELEKAFGGNIALPYKTGVGAVEPKGFVAPVKLAFVTLGAVLVLLLAHLLSSAGKQNRVVVNQHFSFSDSASSISFVSPAFTLDKWRSNLEFDIYAPVDNSWFELNATLVNTRTGTEYGLAQGVEYYHGYSDGESWTEGSRNKADYLQGIPAGTYKLQVQGIRQASYGYDTGGSPQEFQLRVTYDVANHRNFFICLLALLIWPVVQYVRMHHNEKQRWYNSPFSPYNYED